MYTRQKQIINILIENYVKNSAVTSFSIASRLNVASRTIQRDIRDMKEELDPYQLKIDSGNDGYRLIISDKVLLDKFLSQLVNENRLNKENILNDKNERLHFLIGLLIFTSKPLSAEKIADRLYISRSQLTNDLKEVKEIIKRYNLSINTKSHNGLIINGSEEDKRLCLLREKVNIRHYDQHYSLMIDKTKISRVVEKALKDYSKVLPDYTIQNLILHIEVSLARIIDDQKVEIEGEIDKEEYREELELAKRIYHDLIEKPDVIINDSEIIYLALNIRSKLRLGEDDLIDSRTNEVVVMILDRLTQKYGLNFVGKMDLRINLALHIESLLLRAKNHLLLKNIMLSSIKQNMPFSYELAIEAANILEKIYHIQLNEDEVGYIAVHFNAILEDNIKSKTERRLRILIVYTGRLSESFVFRIKFKELFGEYLSVLDCVDPSGYMRNMDDYDFILSTGPLNNQEEIRDRYLLISSELNSTDIIEIKRKISELFNRKSIVNLFHRNAFFGGIDVTDRKEMLNMMCNVIAQQQMMSEDLFSLVMMREEMGSTLFGNGVVLAHPADPFADVTTIVVSILKEPIDWGTGDASIIFLINVRKNAKDELVKFYAFVAELISRDDLLEKIRTEPTYDNFMDIVQQLPL